MINSKERTKQKLISNNSYVSSRRQKLSLLDAPFMFSAVTVSSDVDK